MKKITAILFILIANIVLLAHSVTFHHHHQEKVCVEKTHCDSEESSHEHDNKNNNHKHDGDNGTDICVLKYTAVIPSAISKQECKAVSLHDSYSFHLGIAFLCFDDYKIDAKACLSSRFRHNQNNKYSSIVRSSLGLRAPPIV